MTFLVGERVSCVIMHINPLVNQESHCTASFRGSWLFLKICQKCLGLKQQRTLAGLAGLSEREAARGALCEEAFQMMPSPNVMLHPVVSKFKCRLILTNLTCVECRICQRCIFNYSVFDSERRKRRRLA